MANTRTASVPAGQFPFVLLQENRAELRELVRSIGKDLKQGFTVVRLERKHPVLVTPRGFELLRGVAEAGLADSPRQLEQHAFANIHASKEHQESAGSTRVQTKRAMLSPALSLPRSHSTPRMTYTSPSTMSLPSMWGSPSWSL